MSGARLKTADANDQTTTMIVSRILSCEVAAFSSRCTRMGCEVPVPDVNRITCPCQGSQFDGAGILVGGPATSDLKKYHATPQGTTVTIEA